MDSVESTVRAYFEALNRSDIDGVVSVFAEDGSLMSDERETVTGHAQLRRTFEGFFKIFSFQRELHVDHIREGAEMAAVLTHTTGTRTMLATNSTMTGISRELFILRKTGTGWRITDYMFNRPGGQAS
jgi:uncharacterized protein (TIGR02246 family)